LLEKVSALDERTLTRISVGMLVYAMVLLIEGIRLMLAKRMPWISACAPRATPCETCRGG